MLGLFVLIWMYFTRWIPIWQWRCELLKFLKKLDGFKLLFAINTIVLHPERCSQIIFCINVPYRYSKQGSMEQIVFV